MERQRQPEKREHQATASSSGKHHPSEHLGRSAKEQERPLRDDAARIRSREKSANDRRPKDSPAMPGMSKDDDYVRRWLAQTGSEINQNLTKSKMQQKGPGECLVS
jgi:hypothetical protein